MSQKVQTQTVISLVKVKTWYIPADAHSYITLRDIGLPMLKIPADFLPTLQLATRPRNIRATATPFSKLFEHKLSTIRSKWEKVSVRTCKFTDTRLVFEAAVSPKHREFVAKLEANLAQFFARWGYRYAPTYSETATKCKLVIDFSFDAALNPVIPIVEPDVITSHEVMLGFTKIKITFYDKPPVSKGRSTYPPYILLEVLSKTGDSWQSVHTQTFTDGQIGDLDSILGGFGVLYSRLKSK